MKKISLILISLFILVGCSTNSNSLKEEKKVININEVNTVDKEIEPRDNYSPLDGNITSTSNKGKFVVKKGYSCFKVGVKAFTNSGNITCTIQKGSYTDDIIKQFKVIAGTDDAYIVNCSEGTYCVSFSSSGNMNGQFNVKVAISPGELS